jgi:hypothetical protein
MRGAAVGVWVDEATRDSHGQAQFNSALRNAPEGT